MPAKRLDHDLIRELLAEGVSQSYLAHAFGVTIGAIGHIKQGRYFYTCIRCGSLRSSSRVTDPDFDHICGSCKVEERYPIHENELLCGSCKRWLPDEQYSPRADSVRRRGRATECKECAASRRRISRQKRFASL